MKIAIVVWDLNIRGGTQRQALELASSLQNMGHHVDVYTYFYDKDECYVDLCEKLNIYAANDVLHQRNAALHFSLWRKIVKGYISPFFSPGKSIYQLKEMIDLNQESGQYDVINFHDNEVYKLSRIMKHPNMVWMMNDVPRSGRIGGKHIFLPALNFLKYLFVFLLLKIEIKNIRNIVVLDNRNHFLCKKKYNINTIIVRSGIDLEMYRGIKINRSYKASELKIFASSIFYPHRRFEDIVDAMEILKNRNINFSAIINGRIGQQRQYYTFIKDRIRQKGLESDIEITNGLNEIELKEHYCNADFFIFPNHNQTWGLAVFEAMLAGCICIVSKTSGASEVLINNKNAILIDPLHPEQIADNIIRLSMDKKNMKEISAEAINFVRGSLSWDNYARQMLAVFG